MSNQPKSTPGPWEAKLIEEQDGYKSWGVDPNICTVFYVRHALGQSCAGCGTPRAGF